MSFFSMLAQGAGVIGSLFGQSSSDRQARMAREQQAREFEYQKWLNANQVQLRVKDAQAAGVHPLYALSPTGASFSPSVPISSDSGSFLAEAGQEISRAYGANRDARMREAQLMREAEEAAHRREKEDVLYGQQVERNSLENDLLRSRIARLNSPGSGPGVPAIENVGPGVVEVRPALQTSPGANPGREAGTIRDYGYADTSDGGLTVVPSRDVKERIEDNIFQEFGWELRNGFLPQIMGSNHRPSLQEYPLPVGQNWEYDFTRGAYYPQDIRTGQFIRRR